MESLDAILVTVKGPAKIARFIKSRMKDKDSVMTFVIPKDSFKNWHTYSYKVWHRLINLPIDGEEVLGSEYMLLSDGSLRVAVRSREPVGNRMVVGL